MDTDLSYSTVSRFQRIEDYLSSLIHDNGTPREEGESSTEHIDRAVATKDAPADDETTSKLKAALEATHPEGA